MRSALLACALLAAVSAQADQPGPPLYAIESGGNTVYLLGSVHVLRDGDLPLPEHIEAAYADAEQLVFEIDPASMNSSAAGAALAMRAMFQDGRRLQDVLTKQTWGELSAYASERKLDLNGFAMMEPWFVSLTLLSQELVKHGFRPDQGVEHHLGGRAGTDQKGIGALETVDEQFDLFDRLPIATQEQQLLQFLDESGEVKPQLDRLIDAWRDGRIESLEGELMDSFKEYPDLYESLIVNRNRNWVPRIEALIGKDEDYLVVVGAFHLVGKDSVLHMLRERGLSPKAL